MMMETDKARITFFLALKFKLFIETMRKKIIPESEAKKALLVPEANKQKKQRPRLRPAGRRHFFLAIKAAVKRGKKAARKKAKELGSL